MDWVKRNLAFVIGAAVAVGLLGFSGYFLYANSKKNSDARQQLEREYSELKRLHSLDPHPGKDEVDNIRTARQQIEELGLVLEELVGRFEPIPAIPAGEKVSGEEFSAKLRYTVEQLNREARASSVIVPTNYNFSFEAESRLVKFDEDSLNELAIQLGEVKAICEVLFDAKVNKLTGLRREQVSPDDAEGPKTDYLEKTATTNELAVIPYYEISFESFSAELAGVLAGFANSSHGLLIEGLDIVPAASGVRGPMGRGGYEMEMESGRGFYPTRGTPAPTQTAPGAGAWNAGEMEGGGYGRYTGGYGRGGGGTPQIRRPEFNRPDFGQNRYLDTTRQTPESRYANPYGARAAQVSGAQATAAGAAVSQTLIDEHPLSVTMRLRVIRLLPQPEESL